MSIANAALTEHPFLNELFADAYFPDELVQKGREILVRLCERIEAEEPGELAEVYLLTHGATEEFNDLALEFEEQGSEIETAARDAIAGSFELILRTYGYEADLEEAIAPRDW